MGSLLGYSKVFILKTYLLYLYTILTLLDIVKESIFSISNFFGISNSFEPEPSQGFQENHTPTSTEPSLSAMLIRELLSTNKFSELNRDSHGGLDGQKQQQEEQPLECAVCLYEFEGDQEIRCMKNCQHFFHSDCIDGWIDHDRKTCPLCRKSIVPVHLQDEYNKRLWEASCPDYDLYSEDYELPIF